MNMLSAPVLTSTNFRLRAAGVSHPGLVRENNEDNFLIEPEMGLFLLADGMGGHQAGEVASRVAIEAISGLLHKFSLRGRFTPNFLLPQITSAVHKSIRKYALRDEHLVGMGTTLVAAWWPQIENKLWLLHVGDSRAYLLRNQTLKLLTEDHTYYNEWRRSGQLTDDVSEWMPRNILTQALGYSNEIFPDISSVDLVSGDRLLLCSDGLTDLITEDEILDILSSEESPAEICECLVDAALSQGGRDNITVLILDAV
jgi:PPM family protein phosphatase